MGIAKLGLWGFHGRGGRGRGASEQHTCVEWRQNAAGGRVAARGCTIGRLIEEFSNQKSITILGMRRETS
jgi:hypothetical protein